ncbi:MAG: glycogen-binding domain-containing protein [Acidiferrobacter sp.]
MAHNRKQEKGRKGRRWLAGSLLLLTLSAAYAHAVIFRMRARGARQVWVCGSFDRWRCLPLHRGPHGMFHRRIALAPGLYEYGFQVDGHWRVTRHGAHVPDGLGGVNNLLSVGP